MQGMTFRRTLRRATTGALAASLALTVLAAVPATAGGPKDHFKATIPNNWQGESDNLWSPQDYEAAAAAEPEPDGTIFYSRCRKAPFQSSSLYSPFAGDVIVGDTSFAYADGSTCVNPQNEQNIVINPTNPQNIVTSANEYRARALASTSPRPAARPGQRVPQGVHDLQRRTGRVQEPHGRGDPVLAFGPDGSGSTWPRSCSCGPSTRQLHGRRGRALGRRWHDLGPRPHWSRTGDAGHLQRQGVDRRRAEGRGLLTWTRFLQGPRAPATTARRSTSPSRTTAASRGRRSRRCRTPRTLQPGVAGRDGARWHGVRRLRGCRGRPTPRRTR